MARKMTPLIERLMRKVEEDESGCWMWTGYIRPDGRGHIGKGRAGEGMVLVHRASYEYHVGEIPQGLTLDHLCMKPACVNPDHLEPVPVGVNVKRAVPWASQQAKTHCPKGHAYDETNTILTYRGWRQCRACRNACRRRHYAETGKT